MFSYSLSIDFSKRFWKFSFEVRGGPRLFQLAINALDVSGGSNTAIERDLFAPLRQFVLAGEDTGRYQSENFQIFWGDEKKRKKNPQSGNIHLKQGTLQILLLFSDIFSF